MSTAINTQIALMHYGSGDKYYRKKCQRKTYKMISKGTAIKKG